MTKAYEDMLEALRTSVLEIVAADPADREARLKKSFDDFEEALKKRLEADLPLDITEADPVSLLGDRLARMNDAIEAIESGAVPGAKALHEDSLMLAKGAVEFGALALHACAADFAEPVSEDDTIEEGFGLYKVQTSAGEVLVKSALPQHAAELIADKADVAEKVAEFFIEGLDWLGVPVRLAKKAPVPKDNDDEDEDYEEEEGDDEVGPEDDEGASEEDEVEPEEDESGEEDDSGDEGEDEIEMGGGEEDSSPFDNIARLASLALIELDAVKQQLGPEADNEQDQTLSALEALGQHLALAVVTADALNNAIANADMDEDIVDEDEEASRGEEEEANKAVHDGDLAKAQDVADEILGKAAEAEQRAAIAEQRAAEAERKIAELEKALGAQPAEPRARTGVGVTVLTKSEDTGALSESQEEREQRLANLMKVDPGRAAEELIKEAFKHPVKI